MKFRSDYWCMVTEDNFLLAWLKHQMALCLAKVVHWLQRLKKVPSGCP